jgi:hypothetical protein
VASPPVRYVSVNIAIAIRSTLNVIIDCLSLPYVLIAVCTDSLSLYECLVKLGTTKEKRLMIDIVSRGTSSVTICHVNVVLPGIGPIYEHGTFEHFRRPSSSLFPRRTFTRPPAHHMYIILLVSFVEQSTFSFISALIRQTSWPCEQPTSEASLRIFGGLIGATTWQTP